MRKLGVKRLAQCQAAGVDVKEVGFQAPLYHFLREPKDISHLGQCIPCHLQLCSGLTFLSRTATPAPQAAAGMAGAPFTPPRPALPTFSCRQSVRDVCAARVPTSWDEGGDERKEKKRKQLPGHDLVNPKAFLATKPRCPRLCQKVPGELPGGTQRQCVELRGL